MITAKNNSVKSNKILLICILRQKESKVKITPEYLNQIFGENESIVKVNYSFQKKKKKKLFFIFKIYIFEQNVLLKAFIEMKNEKVAEELLENHNDTTLSHCGLKIFIYYSNIKKLYIPSNVPSSKSLYQINF